MNFKSIFLFLLFFSIIGLKAELLAPDPYFSNRDDYTILKASMKNFTIVEGFKAYPSLKKDGEMFLPLSDIVNGFEFPIFVNSENGVAKGWFMKEGRDFFLDIKNKTLTADGTTLSLGEDDVRWGEDELYINSSILDKIFPVKTKIDKKNLMLEIESLEPMPFEQKLDREKKQKLLRSTKFRNVSYKDDYIESTDLFTIPFLDFGLNYTQSKNSNNTQKTLAYSLGGNGLMFGLDSAFNFYGNSTNDNKFARLNLSRYRQQSDFLGFAKFFEMGDISTYDIDLISSSSNGRGFNISTFDEKGQGTQRSYKLQGQLMQGWEVEVYRNNVLMDFTTGDGTGLYSFDNLSLQMGANKFKLIFYGPQGEIREEEKVIHLTPTSVRKGRWAYRNFVQEDVKPLIAFNDQQVQGRRAGTTGEYGLADNFSITGGLIFYDPMDDKAYIQERNKFRAMIGAKTGFSVFRFALSSAFSEDTDLPAVEGLAEANWKNLNLFVNHSEFNELKTEKSYLDNRYLKNETKLNTRFRIPIPYIATLPFFSRIQIAESVEGLKYKEMTNTLSLSWWRFYLSSELRNRVNFAQAKTDTLTNYLNIQLGKYAVRGETRYNLNKHLLESTSLGINARYNKTNIQTKWNRTTGSDSTHRDFYSVQASRNFSFGTFGAGFSTSSEDDQMISISYNASLLNNPIEKSFFLAESGESSQGAIVAQSYLDTDYDGVFSKHEEKIDGASYRTNGYSGDGKNSFISGLGEYSLVNIKMDEKSLGEISHYPNEDFKTVMPRSGVATKVNLGVVSLGAIDGEIKLVRKGRYKGLKGIRIFVKKDGKRIAETLTDSEGYYTFEKLKPDFYIIGFDEMQMKILRYKLPPPLHIKINKGSVL